MLIDYIDPVERLIYLSEDTMNISWHPVDLYKEVRDLRKNSEDLRGYDNFMEGAGNVDKGGGKATERYFTLMLGTRIVPYNANHIIDITGTLITDDGYEGAFCFDKTYLSEGVSVDIQYAPKQVEVINLNFDDLVYSSFQGAVWVDVINGHDNVGTDNMPNGNSERPVNGIDLATQIARERGFRTIKILESMVIDTNVEGFMLEGISSVNTVLNILDEAECRKTVFKAFSISGILDGDSEIKKCIVNGLEYFDGYLRDCTIDGMVTLSGAGHAVMERCKTLDIGSPAIINGNSSEQNLVMPNWNGPLILRNITEDVNIGIGVDAGKIIIEPSCTGGTIATSGAGTMIDNSAETCYVVNDMVDGTDILNIRRLIEYLRPHHTSTGDMWFWDPYGGDDDWDGKAASRAFKTFAKAHTMAGHANHDTIMIIPGNPSGETVITEKVVVTKDYLFLRGPGRDVIFQVNNDHEDAIRTEAKGTEFSGFRIQHTTTDGHGIHSTGPFTMLENLWFENCTNGAMFESSHAIINNVKFYKPSGFGIRFEGDVHAAEISGVSIGGAGSNGIEIFADAGKGGIKMWDTVITNANEYGIYLSDTTSSFTSKSGNVIMNNASGPYLDLGTNNILNMEGEGGTTPQEVWEYGTRELTAASSSSLTQEEHDQLMASATTVDTVVASQL